MDILCTLADLYILVIIGRSIASFFPIAPDSPFAPVVLLAQRATEPVLAPIRRVIPDLGGFDLSPVVAIIGVRIVAVVLGC